ncbi:MAG: pyruvate formate lyase activating enzyme [Tenuifilum sp.]|jgi:pyruvate formate lyase activating enzyme|uniref:AmmeMemoRadiSam system radical SAM enzyme n=1 Tax=Tenuifilum sp. TaxID=2760880 RepID=UPI0024AB404C|nr:AmmeMemoRadiSam system radical SAM enzyme [Tenuifilum sp.]MDI3526569.1 pyruvate formate lyase activating enzyme [Tenuifilum sp.]
MDALHFRKIGNNKIICELCPHECSLKVGQKGICQTRINEMGSMRLLNFGVIASAGLDPIEKKPLYHFYPGSKIFSIGGYGCNLKCKFCQNYEISQYTPGHNIPSRELAPTDIVQLASQLSQNIGIAYTYNEPTVFYELMYETAILANEKGLKNVMVSNGFINTKPLLDLLDVIDAFNIDLKAFRDDFYKTITGGTIEPVLKNLEKIKKNGNHLEIAFLVIPELNDSKEECKNMFKWIAENLGDDTPVHINRYYPAYKLDKPATPAEKLEELFEIAIQYLKYVYIGNLQNAKKGTTTYCPSCKTKVIERIGYSTQIKMLNALGNCKNCGYGPIANLD